MFGCYTDAGIGKAEVIELFTLTEASDGDIDVRTGVGDDIVRQVSENGVEQWRVTFYI